MAFTYGFYNSFKGDRKYDAIQVSEMFDGILKDGIIPSQGQLFAVTTANNGMQINVGTGRAWFDHTWSKNDSVKVLTVPQSDITRDRWDAVVLEVNHSDDVRANAIKIEQGVAAVNPSKPNLLNTDKIHQYPLAYILVKAGTEEIKAEHIENAVGLTPTVFATGVLETAPLDALWEQWKGEFNTWFSAIKLQLSGDIVTNLQRQIDEVKDEITDVKLDVEWILEKTELVALGIAKIQLKLIDGNGIPAEDVPVSGLCTKTGTATIEYTDSNGIVSGYANANSPSNTNFIIENCGDIEDKTIPATLVAGERYNLSYIIARRNYLYVTSSRTLYFSKACLSVSYSIVGGGGGGASGNASYKDSSGSSHLPTAGGGGGGGSLKFGTYSVTSKTGYSITIGSGGSSKTGTSTAAAGGSGGTTSFMSSSATGGNGGSPGSSVSGGNRYGSGGTGGGGNGGSGGEDAGYAGGSGVSGFYDSYTTTCTVSGGGGGGGLGSYNTSGRSGKGGSPNGGNGARNEDANSSSATSGSQPGGGGGGGAGRSASGSSGYTASASGGRGAAGIRMELKYPIA